ncbi:MAG: aminotransferase class I/II-fold pyridoxal phosphate-dependent enzyme [Planctomycetota bacterium]|jgi:threonine-phosphate decarboxylase
MFTGHGGNIIENALKLGIDTDKLVDISASLSPFKTPEVILNAVRESVCNCEKYPEIAAESLTRLQAENYNIDRNKILAGAGSTEFIYLIPRILNPAQIITFQPTYSDYADSALVSDKKLLTIQTHEDDNFKIKLECLKNTYGKGDILFLCNPNNPTGQLIDSDEILSFARRNQKLYIVVDEAYSDFTAEGNTSLSNDMPANMIIIKSPTKFYRIPGIRLGYCFASPEIISKLLLGKEPWTVSTAALAAGKSVQHCEDYRNQVKESVNLQRAELAGKLEEIPGLTAFPPAANFILCRIDAGFTADQLQEYCLKNHIMIRNASNFNGLDNRFFRIAVMNKETNDMVHNILEKAFLEIR